MAKTDSRRHSVPGHMDYLLQADGSIINYLQFVSNRKGVYYAPQFIGDGVMGEKDQVYVVIGSPYDHLNHKVYRLVELIAITLKQDPSQVWFKDGNPRNVKRGNLMFGPEPEPVEEPPAGEVDDRPVSIGRPGTRRPADHYLNKKIACPHCDVEASPYNLRRHILAKHPGKRVPAQIDR